MRGKKNTLKGVIQLILVVLLTAALVSSGVSAFAADMEQPMGSALFQRYQTGREGFSPFSEPEEIRTVVDDAGTVCYSLADLAQATGNDPTGWQWGFSQVYFHGSLEERRYDIPAYRMDVDGRACEYCDGRVAVSSASTYSVTDPGSVIFLELDGEVYCSATGVEALFTNVMVTDSEIRLLVSGKGKQIRFLAGSGLSQENKAAFTDALWRLFNDYPEGYELVMKQAGRIQLVGRSLARAVTGTERHLAYVTSGSDVIRFTKEDLARTSTEYLAGTLVHECTHLKEYASTGRSSETAPTLAEAKALYALGYPVSRIYDNLVSRAEPYALGVAQALEWLAAVTGNLDQ